MNSEGGELRWGDGKHGHFSSHLKIKLLWLRQVIQGLRSHGAADLLALLLLHPELSFFLQWILSIFFTIIFNALPVPFCFSLSSSDFVHLHRGDPSRESLHHSYGPKFLLDFHFILA